MPHTFLSNAGEFLLPRAREPLAAAHAFSAAAARVRDGELGRLRISFCAESADPCGTRGCSP